MTPIVVPRLNANDDVYTLVEWLLPDGRQVTRGQPIATVEASKVACELVAECSGVLHRVVAVGAECRVGDIVGHLFDSVEDRLRFVATQSGTGVPSKDDDGGVVVTDAAAELARRFDIPHSVLRKLGRAVVRRSDVDHLLAGMGAAVGSDVYEPSRTQRAIAEVVLRSHQTVPAAFTVVKVYSGVLSRVRREHRSANGAPAGLAVLLVKVLAAMCERFPLFFATRDTSGEVHLPAAANVGVTVDVGSGLYVPVIKTPAGRTIHELGEMLSGFQRAARDGTFGDEDLRGANIMLALHHYTGVDFAMPLVLPGHTCALAVGGPQSELYFDESGAVAGRAYLQICLTYDHRLVNGRDAALFARELKLTLESWERLQTVVA